jgi:hypothetical protein
VGERNTCRCCVATCPQSWRVHGAGGRAFLNLLPARRGARGRTEQNNEVAGPPQMENFTIKVFFVQKRHNTNLPILVIDQITYS